MRQVFGEDAVLGRRVGRRAEADPAIDRQLDEVARTAQAESTVLPLDLDYSEVRGLSKEVQQKLAEHRPETIGQAGRIQGVTPAAISLLLVYLKRKRGAAALNDEVKRA